MYYKIRLSVGFSATDGTILGIMDTDGNTLREKGIMSNEGVYDGTEAAVSSYTIKTIQENLLL